MRLTIKSWELEALPGHTPKSIHRSPQFKKYTWFWFQFYQHVSPLTSERLLWVYTSVDELQMKANVSTMLIGRGERWKDLEPPCKCCPVLKGQVLPRSCSDFSAQRRISPLDFILLSSVSRSRPSSQQWGGAERTLLCFQKPAWGASGGGQKNNPCCHA